MTKKIKAPKPRPPTPEEIISSESEPLMAMAEDTDFSETEDYGFPCLCPRTCICRSAISPHCPVHCKDPLPLDSCQADIHYIEDCQLSIAEKAEGEEDFFQANIYH